ncbi:MAG TPA: hypothetical protein VI935_02450 [Thermodesulfobacteriota bacterium]|nr:hypothetical protein [Thermodesulfobacteriota bacterium]
MKRRHTVTELCHFLGVDAPDDYLNDRASIVIKSPHKADTKHSGIVN